jgi:phenylalanyl-tRNA synthetase beta chain
MLVPLSWLREYVRTDLSAAELAHVLMMGGFEVEGIEGEGDEAVLDLKATSNRGDCLSMLGIAREVAALTGAAFVPTSITLNESDTDINDFVTVEIVDADLCPRYSARLVTGVVVRDSPAWLRERLQTAGLPAINNVVDITNYVMWELGQPLHAFDFGKIAEAPSEKRAIIIRRAKAGERIVTIDHVERELNEDALVIADALRPVALAGVMGGVDTEISVNTVDVLIESAHFDPANNRRTSKLLGLPSESSYRFQRRVDPSGTAHAADRAAQLMAQICGGHVARGVVDAYPKPHTPVKISLRPQRVNQLLGTQLSAKEMTTLLMRLGFEAHPSTLNSQLSYEVTVPIARGDVTQEADLTEEIARIYGYDNVPTTIPPDISPHAGEGASRKVERRAKDILLRCGLTEVITFSLTRPANLTRAGLDENQPALTLRNPLSEDWTTMRTTLIPSLLEVLSRNARNGVRDVGIFELGRAYLLQTGNGTASVPLPDERRLLGLAMMGNRWGGAWNMDKATNVVDFYALKSAVEELLNGLHVSDFKFQRGQHPSLHPGRTAELVVSGQSVGVLGELHPNVQAAYDLTQRVYVAELDFDLLAQQVKMSRRYEPIPTHPPAERDVAMIVTDEVESQAIVNVMLSTGVPLLESVQLFDVYTGAPIPEGHKNLAYSLTFRAEGRTLTTEEVEETLRRIKEALREKVSAQIRE